MRRKRETSVIHSGVFVRLNSIIEQGVLRRLRWPWLCAATWPWVFEISGNVYDRDESRKHEDPPYEWPRRVFSRRAVSRHPHPWDLPRTATRSPGTCMLVLILSSPADLSWCALVRPETQAEWRHPLSITVNGSEHQLSTDPDQQE